VSQHRRIISIAPAPDHKLVTLSFQPGFPPERLAEMMRDGEHISLVLEPTVERFPLVGWAACVVWTCPRRYSECRDPRDCEDADQHDIDEELVLPLYLSWGIGPTAEVFGDHYPEDRRDRPYAVVLKGTSDEQVRDRLVPMATPPELRSADRG
jgi:hypothetical protein